MTKDELFQLKHHFHKYIDTFLADSDNTAPFLLKKEHTKRVCHEILLLGKALGLASEDLLLAEACALFHDIGRFKQYQTYQTFLDTISENHAVLGLKEIAATTILDTLSSKERKIIKTAVSFHNALAPPKDCDEKTLLFTKLLRDADKLDIWRVMCEHYLAPESDDSNYITLNLNDDGKLSNYAVEAVCRHTFVKQSMVKRLNDLKLLQISWIFDLNFPESIARVKKMGYIDTIASTLPESPALNRALEQVAIYMEDERTYGNQLN